MRYSKLLKSRSIRRLSNRESLLSVFLFWFLSAVCVSLSMPPILLASPLDGVFGHVLENRPVLLISHYDLKFGLSEAFGLPRIDGFNAKREPFSSSLFKVDVDLDGDVDLIDLSKAPRILIWMNDGRGRFFPLTPSSYNLVRVCTYFYESAENDFLSVWLEPHELRLDSVALGLVLKEIPVVYLNGEDDTPRSPRAPPASMNKA